MTDILLVGVGTAAIIVAFTAAREALRWSWIRELRQLNMADRNRNRFGELRTRLMALARQHPEVVKTERFIAAYRALSVLMRSPQMYPDAATLILVEVTKDVVLGEDKDVPMSHAEIEIWQDFANRFDDLCNDYSRLYRTLGWVVRFTFRFPEAAQRPPTFAVIRLLKQQQRRNRDVVLARSAERRLRNLAKEAHSAPNQGDAALCPSPA